MFGGLSLLTLLDANESTWVFETADCVGCGENLQARQLGVLASDGLHRNYCGRTADAGFGSIRRREKALSRSMEST